jgi:hypothetical protein
MIYKTLHRLQTIQWQNGQTMIYKTLHRLQTIQWQTNNDLQNTTQITDNTMVLSVIWAVFCRSLFVRSAIVLSVICVVFYRSLFVRSAIILSVICVGTNNDLQNTAQITDNTMADKQWSIKHYTDYRQYNGRQTMIYKTLHRLQTIQWQTNNDLQNTTQITGSVL